MLYSGAFVWFFVCIPLILWSSVAVALEHAPVPMVRTILSLPFLPETQLRQQWNILEGRLTPAVRGHPSIRLALRGAQTLVAARAAARESVSCASDCHYQFCYQSYGCIILPFGAVALTAFSAHLPVVATALMGTLGSLAACVACSISTLCWASDYSAELQQDYEELALRAVAFEMSDLLQEPTHNSPV
jgi:hypothetical protein